MPFLLDVPPFRRLRAHTLRAGVGAFALALLCVVAFACSDGPTGPEDATPITELPRSLSEVELEVLAASNAFAFSLAKELLPEAADANLFYSPLSASMLLGMLLNGADGNTYAQMRSMLGFDGLTQEEINQGYSELVDLLLGLDPSVTIEVGNSIWTKLGFPIVPDFLARVQTSFGAEVEAVDFADPGTLGRINGWASEATHGRIETIFDELPPNVIMVLLNAIYFKASWVTRFDAALTERAPFTRPDGSQVTADLMYLDGHDVPMRHRDGVTMVELPYGGGAFSMVVALPDPSASVEDFLREMTDQSWEAWMSELAPGRAYVRLPRFELAWEEKLNDPLMALGMTDAFGPADFSRLTPGGGVWLDIVKQKAFVKVDEEGTEAAAVTGGAVVTSAPAEIRFDRPFLFVLRERLTGAILFMGVIHDPTG